MVRVLKDSQHCSSLFVCLFGLRYSSSLWWTSPYQGWNMHYLKAGRRDPLCAPETDPSLCRVPGEFPTLLLATTPVKCRGVVVDLIEQRAALLSLVCPIFACGVLSQLSAASPAMGGTSILNISSDGLCHLSRDLKRTHMWHHCAGGVPMGSPR